ncbi:hypothetical protein K7W42_18155 [Deinococcus sp. HMF7604]|uniref:hypothetical protein n=1 Tax=Deinococcus betulae TaxID=2873312 RepID=UPI001CCE797D|nr:hypothetical protein [Deinococcus betulae]MBZ9752767.1 hypothetical protein [Deinococcus betulae]
MAHHVLEMYDCLDDSGWRRLFEQNDVEPQFSRHGEARSILCITWNSSEVQLHVIFQMVDSILRLAKAQCTLYTNVIEPPYRMQPDILDHGEIFHQWWRGRFQNLLLWPEGDDLPEALRQAVVRLFVEGRIHEWPAIVPQENGLTLQVIIDPAWRSRREQDCICDTLEAHSTPDHAVRVAFVAPKQSPYFPWVKRPTNEESKR